MTNQYALGYKAGLDAAVKVCREAKVTGANEDQSFGHTVGVMQCAELISRLPVPEVQWRDLTDSELEMVIASECIKRDMAATDHHIARAVIAKFKEKQL